MTLLGDLQEQFTAKPPYPTTDFSGKVIIVTGANIGLGKEAAKHFVRLNAARVILAVRSLTKGEAAVAEIEAETQRTGACEVWELDYASYASVQAFGAKAAAALDRVDAVVLNAGLATAKFELFEDNESSITVNVVSTILLALLLLPTLRASAARWSTVPVISIVSTGLHAYAQFPERETPNALMTLNDPKTAAMSERYQVSKLIQLFAAREMADRTAKGSKPVVVINTVNPGLCNTSLTRHATGTMYVMMKIMKALAAWTAEEGSRTLVYAAGCGAESHGVYISGCKIPNQALGKFVDSEEGQKTQEKVWAELAVKLEAIQPGTTKEM